MSKEQYTIVETLSEGPSTTVYKALQNVLGRTVLLKVLHRHLLEDRELVERFRREAAALAMLRTDSIVQVYNLDDIDGRPAIVMEYVEGQSLRQLLAQGAERSETFARHVAEAVLRGLADAHRRGIIHRDIKPGNILVTSDGAVRITDFGLASILASPSLTVEGVLVGTPAYMSPEQAKGEALDFRTDLFSLGITLVEIVSGKQIFFGNSYGECINKIVHFRTEALGPLLAGTTPEFQRFVAQLMNPDKEARFASAGHAVSALTGEPLPARSGAVRRLIWPVGAGFLGITALVIAGYYLAGDDTGPGPMEPGRRESSAVVSDSTRNDPETDQQDGPRTRARAVPATKGPIVAIDTATTASAARDSGYISITSIPWSKVYLDDQYIGTTPIAGTIRVKAGPHTIAFNNPQFTPIIRTITVGPNEEHQVDGDFLKSSGYLLFTVKPWADIYVDDQHRETTPISQPLVVSSGTRIIRLHNPSFPDHTEEISVTAGDTLRISYDFQAPRHE